MLRAIIPEEDAEFLWSSKADAAMQLRRNSYDKLLVNFCPNDS